LQLTIYRTIETKVISTTINTNFNLVYILFYCFTKKINSNDANNKRLSQSNKYLSVTNNPAPPPGGRLLTHHAIRALLRLRFIIQTSLLGSHMRKSAWSTGRVNIGPRGVLIYKRMLSLWHQLCFRYSDETFTANRKRALGWTFNRAEQSISQNQCAPSWSNYSTVYWICQVTNSSFVCQ